MIIKRRLFSHNSNIIDKILYWKKTNISSRYLENLNKNTKGFYDYTIPINKNDKYNCVGAYWVHPDLYNHPELSRYIIVFVDSLGNLSKLDFPKHKAPNPIQVKSIIINKLEEFNGISRTDYTINEFKQDLINVMRRRLKSINSAGNNLDNDTCRKVVNAVNEEINFIKKL